MLWILVKVVFKVSDRILPAPFDVLRAIKDIQPNIFVHALFTAFRLIVGFLSGTLLGITLGIVIYRSQILNKLLSPTIQSLRSIPPIATVPFFILWFGFSETGRFVMVITGIGFNIAIAAHQILSYMPEKYQVMYNSFNKRPHTMLWSYMLPRLADELLPTIRFSLSISMGIVIVSELLGAQTGLGYLIQTSRSTYSMHVIFLAMILLGAINYIFDKSITKIWETITFWRK